MQPPDGKKRVLIVDNDAGMRDIMERIVRDMGHEVQSVERATRAIKIVMEEWIDLILLDLHMPGPHGDHLLSFLRSRKVLVPPTIIVSGYLHRDAIGPLIKLGVRGIVAKPFEIRRFTDEVNRVLGSSEPPRFRFCPRCGAPSTAEDHFCRQCGNDLRPQLQCPGCQTLYSPGDRFCNECGRNLGTNTNA